MATKNILGFVSTNEYDRIQTFCTLLGKSELFQNNLLLECLKKMNLIAKIFYNYKIVRVYWDIIPLCISSDWKNELDEVYKLYPKGKIFGRENEDLFALTKLIIDYFIEANKTNFGLVFTSKGWEETLQDLKNLYVSGIIIYNYILVFNIRRIFAIIFH